MQGNKALTCGGLRLKAGYHEAVHCKNQLHFLFYVMIYREEKVMRYIVSHRWVRTMCHVSRCVKALHGEGEAVAISYNRM